MSDTDSGRASGGSAAALWKKLLMPLVATTASAVATYAARRGSQYLEAKVSPLLADLREESGRAAARLPVQARAAADGAGGLADGLVERVRGVAGDAGQRESRRTALSPKERERRWAERAEHRQRRRGHSRS